MIEVIEHLNPLDLDKAIDNIFSKLKPVYLFLTTPNIEYNHIISESFSSEKEGFRHPDHKFEWNRLQFLTWCNWICENYHYSAEIGGIGQCLNNLNINEFGYASHFVFFSRYSGLNRNFEFPKKFNFQETIFINKKNLN